MSSLLLVACTDAAARAGCVVGHSWAQAVVVCDEPGLPGLQAGRASRTQRAPCPCVREHDRRTLRMSIWPDQRPRRDRGDDAIAEGTYVFGGFSRGTERGHCQLCACGVRRRAVVARARGDRLSRVSCEAEVLLAAPVRSAVRASGPRRRVA